VDRTLAAPDPAWAAKMAKTANAYQDTLHGHQNCADCKIFEPPSSCKVVDGVISPKGGASFGPRRPVDRVPDDALFMARSSV
jgi:hypothetical protein